MVSVDLWRLGYESHALLAVFVDVGFGARVDEVDLEIREEVLAALARGCACSCNEPIVDVVRAKILQPCQ